MQFRERKWCGANRFKSANDRIKKLIAKTVFLLLLPCGRFDYIMLRLIPESDNVAHSRLRISATTSVIGRPKSPSAS